MIYGLIIIFMLIAFIEIPRLFRERLWRELVAFSVFFTIGFLLSLLQVLGIKVPNPNEGIKTLIEMVAKVVME